MDKHIEKTVLSLQKNYKKHLKSALSNTHLQKQAAIDEMKGIHNAIVELLEEN